MPVDFVESFLFRISLNQGPTLVFWAQVELDKLRLSSWLVTLVFGLSSNHLTSDSLSSQLVKSSWKETPLKSHAQAVWRTPPRCLKNPPHPGGGGSGHSHGQKKGQNRSHLKIFGENDVIGTLASCVVAKHKKKFLELFCDVLQNERPDFDLAVLLRRWWFLRSRLYTVRESRNSCYSLTLYLPLLFLCRPCEQNSDCLYNEKDVGGGLCHGHISHLVPALLPLFKFFLAFLGFEDPALSLD